MVQVKNLAHLVALHSVDGLGPIRLKRLISHFQDPKLVWDAELKEISALGIPQNVLEILKEKKKSLDPQKYFEQIQNSGIKILNIFDEDYPQSLKDIYDPPVILYYKGNILPKDTKAFGVVGTRKITSYGKIVTEKLTSELISFGFTIVSGLARGVDTTAHKTALESKGRTLAVLGGGVNRIFPPENTRLALKIIDGKGAILSEYPPDYPSLSGNFPSRNRIISGLSKAVLVTEAAEDSGSLITARLALDQGRDVFAVPGPITSSLSEGTASLIKEGAKLTSRIEDILDELGINQNQKSNIKDQKGLNFTKEEKQILQCLENEQKHIDEICRELKISTSQLSALLIKMEILGAVKNLGGGIYIKT